MDQNPRAGMCSTPSPGLKALAAMLAFCFRAELAGEGLGDCVDHFKED